MELSKLIPIDISIVALVISIIGVLWNYFINQITVRYTARNQYMSVLFDIDKQLIANPKLWRIYDKYPKQEDKSPGTDESDEAGRRRAFIFYHINLFEIIFNDYHNVPLHLNKADRQFSASWNTYMKHFFTHSK